MYLYVLQGIKTIMNEVSSLAFSIPFKLKAALSCKTKAHYPSQCRQGSCKTGCRTLQQLQLPIVCIPLDSVVFSYRYLSAKNGVYLGPVFNLRKFCRKILRFTTPVVKRNYCDSTRFFYKCFYNSVEKCTITQVEEGRQKIEGFREKFDMSKICMFKK